MSNTICLDKSYSTTKLLTKEKPSIENNLKDKFETILFLSEGESRKAEGGLRKKRHYKKSYEDKPLISIITVVFNGEKYLEETIKSVINQSYDNIEYIIIDGGSTDETIDIIKKYEKQINYWVSEPDSGIYDAMNKGIQVSHGDLIGMINADDYYVKDAITEIVMKYTNKEEVLIYGDLGVISGENRRVINAHQVGKKYGLLPYSRKWIWLKMIFGHPTVFVSKSLYKNYGLYDTSFKISADYEFFIRVIQKKVKMVYLQRTLAWFRTDGISSTNNKLVQKENYLARKNNNSIIAYMIEVILRKKLFWKSI